jgi:hypothetical protein
MRVPVLALLASFFSASYASAGGVVVERSPNASTAGITVSWHLPPGFEESELLLQIDGGPRVRLTDELRGQSPRVVVVLPLLTGSARFVVRAGRKDEARGGKHREIDVARSERFSLVGLPTTGRVPVRAAATRPAPGATMEWWAEAARRPVEGPSAALESPATAAISEAPFPSPALPASRPLPATSPTEAVADAGAEAPFAPLASANGVRDLAFSGATTPLRN